MTSSEQLDKIRESFTYINNHWFEEDFKDNLDTWKMIHKHISFRITPHRCHGCGTHWVSENFVLNHGICPRCDTWLHPILSNPINKESVLSYIDPKWHRYIFEEDVESENRYMYAKRRRV